MTDYQPIPEPDWDRMTEGLNSNEQAKVLRRERQSESDTLNSARKAEIREAALTGRAIAKVVYEWRQADADPNDPRRTGWGGFEKACKALGVDPVVMAGRGQPADTAATEVDVAAAEEKAERIREMLQGTGSIPQGAQPGDDDQSGDQPGNDGDQSGDGDQRGDDDGDDQSGDGDGEDGGGEAPPPTGGPYIPDNEESWRTIATVAEQHAEIGAAEVHKAAMPMMIEAATAAAREAVIQPVHVTIPDQPEPAEVEGTHDAFPMALRTAACHGRLLLHGPKGTGKSTIVRGIADAMGYGDDYRIVSCTAETSIYDLLGARDAEGTFHPGPVLEAYEKGMVLFLDEFDALDPATGVALNAILDGGDTAPVPQRTGDLVARKADRFLPMIAVNTLGGHDDDYTGRVKQDGATLSRFPAIVRLFVDYCRPIETAILAESPRLAEAMWALRDAVKSYNLDAARTITTRDFASAAREVAWRKADGSMPRSDREILEATTSDWAEQERLKVCPSDIADRFGLV